MLFIILTVSFYLISYILSYYETKGYDIQGLDIFFIIFSIITIMVGFVFQFIIMYDYINREEKIIQENEKIKIYKSKVENVFEEMKTYLLTEYKQYEKEILELVFSSIKSSNLLFAKFPDIKTNEMILKMVEKMESYTNSIYCCKLEIEELKRLNRVSRRTCRLFVIPIFPKEKLE